MANNGGKLARSSTLKLFKLGSNHCADDPVKGLEPHTKKRKVERGGKARGGRKKGQGNRGAGPGMHIVVSGQLLFYPYHSLLPYVWVYEFA